MIFGFSFSYITWRTSWGPPLMSSHTALHADRRIPRTYLDVPPHPALSGSLGIPRVSQDPPWMSPHTQPSRQSGGSQGHPRILHGCPPTPSPPISLEDPKGIPGSSLDVPHTHSPCCPQDPNDIPVSSLNIHPHSPLGSPEDPMIFPGCPHTRSTTHDPDMTQSAWKWLEKA